MQREELNEPAGGKREGHQRGWLRLSDIGTHLFPMSGIGEVVFKRKPKKPSVCLLEISSIRTLSPAYDEGRKEGKGIQDWGRGFEDKDQGQAIEEVLQKVTWLHNSGTNS